MQLGRKFVLFTLFSILCFPLKAQNPPNVVLILVDDQGWNGTSVQMDTAVAQSLSDYYKTPNLAQFALEGQIFSQAYAPAPKCAPTRASILTGQTTAKNRLTNTTTQTSTDSFLVDVSSLTQLDSSLVTFPELLKASGQGYMTGHYGKWHLGPTGPEGNGFDRGDGPTSNNDGDQGGTLQNDPKKIFSITDSAMSFITDAVQQGNPFYVQLSHYAVHTPIETLPTTLNAWTNTTNFPPGTIHSDSTYGSMTADLDSSFGMLMDTLSQLGIDSNTYVIWYSDNGASRSVSNNRPLSQGKIFLSEGGIRVPLIIRGQGIPQGSRSAVPVIGYDLFPTILDWAEGNLANVPSNVEGGSIKGLLTAGGTGTVARSNSLIFHSPHYDTPNAKEPQSAIIEGQYKLIVNYESGEMELFDLQDDIQEQDNLYDSLPTVAHDLCVELRDYFKIINAEMPTLNPAYPGNSGTLPDVDEDGLEDEWEFRELLTVAYDSIADPDGDGISNGMEQTLGSDPYVFDSLITNRDQVSPQNPIIVFPNPGKGFVNIKGIEAADELTIVNSLGQVLHTQTGGTLISLHLIPAGTYFLTVRRDKQLIHQELLMVRKD